MEIVKYRKKRALALANLRRYRDKGLAIGISMMRDELAALRRYATARSLLTG